MSKISAPFVSILFYEILRHKKNVITFDRINIENNAEMILLSRKQNL